MSGFLSVGWFDTWDVATSLQPRIGLFVDGRMPIRIEGEEMGAYEVAPIPEIQKWPAMHRLLRKIEQFGARGVVAGAASQTLLITMGSAHLEILQGMAATPWQMGAGEHVALVAVRTNPLVRMISGLEQAHPLVGQLVVMDRAQPWSAINLGESPAIHLVIGFARGEIADNSR